MKLLTSPLEKALALLSRDQWFEFHRARNLTSHTYNEDVAEEVYEIAIKLPKYVENLLQKIKPRLK